MMRTLLRASLAAAAVSLVAAASPAQVNYTVLEPSGDVSPYSFIQLLNRGDYHTMYTYEAGVFTDGFSHDHQTFIQFDLPPGLLGPNETVLQASLIMVYAFSFSHWPDQSPPAEVDMTLEAREVLASWDEMTLTWANMPAASGTPEDTATGIGFDEYGPIELDVTSLVRDWAEGTKPNYGFKLTNPEERPMGFWTRDAFIDFAAAGMPLDPALKSVLVIVTGVPIAAPAMPAPALVALGSAFVALAGWALRRPPWSRRT